MSEVHLEIPQGAAAIEGLLKDLPGERVTAEYIRSRIKSGHYLNIPNTTVMLCHLMLDNGYSARGESACVDPANFDPEIGRKIAFERAFNSLWPLFGFLLAERRFLEGRK